MLRKQIRMSIAYATLFLVGTTVAQAQLFGVAYQGVGSPSTLYDIDPTDGTATPVGPINFPSVGGIDFAQDGTLYGISGNAEQLITIDPLMGLGSLVGPTSGAGFNPRFDLSFRNSDGILFATGLGGTCVDLATVDLITGLATEVGPSTCDPGNGLAFSTADVLYHNNITGLYTLDQGTGLASFVAPLTFIGFPQLFGPRINALEFHPTTGILYASVNDGVSGSGPNYLATVDATTGVVTHIGQTVNGLDAIAWLVETDSDNDGVLDDADSCPGTTPGADVDVLGCADAQVDADGDGVCDPDAVSDGPSMCVGADLCLDTTPGDAVDVLGCADAQVDADGDGVCDPDAVSDGPGACVDADLCLGTVIPEAVPMSGALKPNRWALGDDGDTNFDTRSPPGGGGGPGRSYTTADTAGCSCEQIIEALDLGRGHTKFGCSISAMDDWVKRVNP